MQRNLELASSNEANIKIISMLNKSTISSSFQISYNLSFKALKLVNLDGEYFGHIYSWALKFDTNKEELSK